MVGPMALPYYASRPLYNALASIASNPHLILQSSREEVYQEISLSSCCGRFSFSSIENLLPRRLRF